VAERSPSQSRGALRTIGELGPAWISSLTGLVVALTAAGFFVGHATANTGASPRPVVTVIKTVKVGESAGSAGSTSATDAGANTGPTSNAASEPNGTELGSYSIDLSAYYSVPLGATKPSQSQFAYEVRSGDLYYTGGDYYPGPNEQSVGLPSGTLPSYEACSTGTTFNDQVEDVAGASFCVIEAEGKLAGVHVTSDESGYAVLQITVWQYVSQ
jgi:hypothetical protein